LSVANSFKTVVDSIQAQARQAPGVATTVRSMDVEVKGLVQVQPDLTTVLVLPTAGSGIDPNLLSTLRLSFAAVPVAAPLPRPAPPAPPPPAAPTPTPPGPTRPPRSRRARPQ